VEKDTLVLVKVIDNWILSLKPITHETKALDVTISFHTNKVISSPKNPIIIGLYWLALHNPRMDWHMRSFHFEAPQHTKPWSVKPLLVACKI
jgi:hypothetical protein